MSKLKVALIGSGGKSQGKGFASVFNSPENWGLQHARIFAGRPDIDFCAVVGRNPERTKQRAEEFFTRPYTDIDEMIRKEQPELVSLCLPNQQHFDVTLDIIKNGIPLLVEKPLVFSMKEADILINEAEKRNLFFAINFNHRYATPVRLAYEDINSSKLGDLTFASWRFGGEGASDHPHANIVETQCHGFDMLEHLCGPIESVMAEMTDKTGGGFRTMSISLRFKNGAVGSLIGTYDSSYAYPESHRVELDGTKGRAVIKDTVLQYSFQETGNETANVWQPGYFNDIDREFHRTFDKYFDDLLFALKDGRKPPVHALAGQRALELAFASVQSYEQGRRVSV